MEKWVVYDFFNSAKQTYAAAIRVVPLASVDYEVISRYHGGKIKVHSNNYELKYLSAPQRGFVAHSLSLQNEDPWDYIEEVTTHGEWKIRKHQGYIFTVPNTYDSVDTGAYVDTRSAEVWDLIPEVLRKLGVI